jgi:hypothetical protein
MNDYPHPMDLMRLPCGGIAEFDEDSGISYRCRVCNTVVGSIGMPKVCKDEIEKYDNWAKLGGQDWDYKMPDDYMDDWA